MKNTLLFSALMLYSFFCFSQGSNGLVGHWDFNGNANDKSGNNLNGLVSGATAAPGYNNIANTAYHFDGLNTVSGVYDNITIPPAPVMNVTRFSICAFVKIDSFNKNTCQESIILSRGISSGSSTDLYKLMFNDNTYDDDCNANTPSNSSFLGETGNMAWVVNPIARSHANYIVPNTWYCVTTTYDGDSLKMYVDGILKKSVYFPYTLQNNNSLMRIGASSDIINQTATWAYPLYGSIDDIRFYNRALTLHEAGLYCDSVKLKIGDPPVDTTDTTTYIHNVVPVDPVIIPNPARQYIDILLPHTSAKGSIQLLNSVGQVVAQQTISGEKTRFDLNAYTPGVYLLKIQYGSQMMFKKFLKE